MAETSYLWNNPGTGDSPAAPGYGDDVWSAIIWRMLLNGTGNLGVLRGWLNELEVTDGGGLNASVATGGAVVYGRFYENTTAATVACPNNSTVWVVAQCGWAAQTIRLAQVAAPLTQTPGVTYEIPLAQVTTVGGAITLITDGREWVEYTTDLHDDVVEEEHIGADQVTTAKLENQTRRLVRSAGMLEPDATNPPTWVSAGLPYRNYWLLANAVTDVLWCSFRVPTDISSANITLYVWNWPVSAAGGGAVQWGWNALIAAPSAVLAATAGTLNVDNTGRTDAGDVTYRDQLTTIAVTAGDIVHMELMRNGGAGGDTLAQDVALDAIEISYTADS